MLGLADILLVVFLLAVVIAWISMAVRGQISVNLYWPNRVLSIEFGRLGWKHSGAKQAGGFLFSSRFLPAVWSAPLGKEDFSQSSFRFFEEENAEEKVCFTFCKSGRVGDVV